MRKEVVAEDLEIAMSNLGSTRIRTTTSPGDTHRLPFLVIAHDRVRIMQTPVEHIPELVQIE
jgi:hypothetical protein